MNRFALELKANEADIRIKFDRKADENTMDLEMLFHGDDVSAVADVWRRQQPVTIIFRYYKVPAIIQSWTLIPGDAIVTHWRAIGPLRAI
jgi:hypothetical protein